MRESEFQAKVMKELKKLPSCWCTVVQAGSIRGIPDILGTVNGVFFAWELKTSQEEARKSTGRTKLQRYNLQKIDEAGGIGRFVYPENLEECLRELRQQVSPT